MKILLTGEPLDVLLLLRAIADTKEHEITHCSGDARAIVELLKNGFDWAIIDGRAVSGSDKEFTRTPCLMGPSSMVDPNRNSSSATFHQLADDSSCGIQWSKNGILELRCALHNKFKQTDRRRKNSIFKLIESGYAVFEYHAPCSKKRAV